MKSIAKSKTIWFNAVSVVVAVLSYLTPGAVPWKVDPMFFQQVAFFAGIGNIALRFMTDKPLATKARAKREK